jgi:hypothetical protein
MTYFQQLDAWLDERLGTRNDGAIGETKRQIKTKILESYHNGQREVARRIEAILKDFASESRQQVRPASKSQPSKPRQ